MTKSEKDLLNMVAVVISKTTMSNIQSALLNALVGCDANEVLSDEEAEVGDFLFNALVDACPEGVLYAQNM